jgi:hypothetical protein
MAQMSCKFGEIIKKLEAVGEMSQTKPHPKRPPPARQVRWRVFSAGFPRGDPRSAEFTRRFDPQ